MGKHDSTRIKIFFGCIVVAASLIGWRLFVLSYMRHTLYSQTAQAQNQNISNILIRGNIFIQDPKATGTITDQRYLVATNKKFPLVYATPANLVDPASVATQLAGILKLDQDNLKKTLGSGSSSAKILARKISTEQADAINKLTIKGVGIRYETDRFYPANSFLSKVIGFLGFGATGNGRVGQYGIESYFDEELSGQKNTSDTSSPRPDDIILTIDRNIQTFIESSLHNVLTKWHASGGSIIVQDPQTGKIIAMADEPTFDLNAYSSAPTSSYMNRNVQEMFEPGSSFKPITMAMGIDLGKITPDTTFTDPGVIDIAGRQIHNFDLKAHGLVTMTQVLEKSLNTGVAFVENLVGQESFLNYTVNFGFGQKTSLDLPGEVSGDVANLYSGRQVNFVTASFGQGVAVTPIQLITAYSALANGGKLMRPYIVDRIIHEGGKEDITQPEVASIPISEKTSAKIRSMLTSVVDVGFDKARIKGYDVAGKTGTAQIADGHGGYQDGVFIHDFLGFAPASNPKFVVLIKMDKPQGITFAADSLSPTFREIAAYLLNYYNIPPTR
ncbi:MAG: penicillin-binding protein 2 [Candidatus Pacebacteria bacterium]|nr:penicillin-binding protein 2 [Candidatus Paceibacterota bacterium]